LKNWTADKIAVKAGAGLGTGYRPTEGPLRCVIDSREVKPGDLFIAIKGERVDGGEFAQQALEQGAWGVLTTHRYAKDLYLLAAEKGAALLTCRDPVTALGRLANAWRSELSAKVVAVTGSSGKTTTREILVGLLKDKYLTHSPKGNYNTEIGLPCALLSAPSECEVVVLELAMRAPGQIAELVSIAKPDYGLITNIGPAHIGELGSIEAIAAAKAELLYGLPTGKTAVVPAGEKYLSSHLKRLPQLVVTEFGDGGEVSIKKTTATNRGTLLELLLPQGRVTLEVPFKAEHMLLNTAAATAVAGLLGVLPSGELEVDIPEGRGEVHLLNNGITVINDSYNANPDSVRVALKALGASDSLGKRVAVLGEMLELGSESLEYHREVGKDANAAGVETLVVVGEAARPMAETFAGTVVTVSDAAAAAKAVVDTISTDDTVLVKASRSVGLELVVKELIDSQSYREPKESF